MAKRVQLIRHVTGTADAFVGLDGEITIDKTAKEVRVHDGLNAGGFAQARKDLANVLAATITNDGKMTAAQVTALLDAVDDIATIFATYVTLAGVQTISGAKTFSADMRIQKANATLYLDSSSGQPAITLVEGATPRSQLYWDDVADVLIIRKFEPTGVSIIAQLDLTAAGKVNVSDGDLQIAGTDLYDIVPRLAVANVFSADQKISKSSPRLELISASGNVVLPFYDAALLRSDFTWDRVGDQLVLQQYDIDGSTARARILLTELGKVNIAIGDLQIAGIDVDAIFASLGVANTFTATQTVLGTGSLFVAKKAIDTVSASLAIVSSTGVERSYLSHPGTNDRTTLGSKNSVGIVKAQVDLIEATGLVDIPTGQLRVTGVTNPEIEISTISASGVPALILSDDGNVERARLQFDNSTDRINLLRYSNLGALQTSLLLEADGNVSVNGATPTQAANLIRKDWAESVFAQLAVANTFTGDLKVEKNTPAIVLNTIGAGAPQINFRSADVTKALIFWEPSGDEFILRQHDSTVPATVRAELKLTELGKVNIATGTFQLAGVDVTANASELSILAGALLSTAELNILNGVTRSTADINDLATKTGAETLTLKTCTDLVLNGTLSGTGLETTITNTDAKVPTSGAVFDKVAGLNTKIIDIGDWDMDATFSLNIAHGLTLSKIRDIQVLIRDDADNEYAPLNLGANFGVYTAIGINIRLQRTTSGAFDSVNYDSTTYNRGWITIQYTD